MKVIEVEKKKLFFEEEKLSPEEQTYREAIGLMESIDCVTRFERAVESLYTAASLLESLGGYKDSAQKAEECRTQAEQTRKAGMQAAYKEAVCMADTAKSKDDYRTAISEFQRFPDYQDSQDYIDGCKNVLRKMAAKQAWKNRGIAALILAALAAIFWISPAKPYTKGLIHMNQGHYRTAIRQFKEANHFLNADYMKKKCRYKQAEKAYVSGDPVRAMAMCHLADGRPDADRLLARIELEQMADRKPGDMVAFGKGTWQILDMEGDTRILLYCNITHSCYFSKDTNEWASSHIRKWMNRTYLKNLLNQWERKLLQKSPDKPQDGKTSKLCLLDREQYTRYKNLLMPAYILPRTPRRADGNFSVSPTRELTPGEWWLADAGSRQDVACYIDTAGKICTDGQIMDKKGVRPMIRISLDEKLLEEE